MQKAVLVSVRTRNFDAVFEGLKNCIFLLKRFPKLTTPYTVYVYNSPPKYGDWNDRSGKVIGQFTCTEHVEVINEAGIVNSKLLTADEWFQCKRIAESYYTPGKPLLGLRMSDCRLYSTPIDIHRFEKPCKEDCLHCKHWHTFSLEEPGYCDIEDNTVQSPPQTWRYVKHVEVTS